MKSRRHVKSQIVGYSVVRRESVEARLFLDTRQLLLLWRKKINIQSIVAPSSQLDVLILYYMEHFCSLLYWKSNTFSHDFIVTTSFAKLHLYYLFNYYNYNCNLYCCNWRYFYLHALGFVYGEAGGAEFPTADVARDGSRAPFCRSRRPDGRLLGSTVSKTILGIHLTRLDLLRPVLVPVATEI